MSNNNRRIGPFNSYKSLFKIQHVIYKLGNIHLWGFGVSFDQMITGAVAGVLIWLIYTIFPLLNLLPLNKWVVIVAGTIAAMWASARYELGGKSILMWSIGIVWWLFRKKYFARGTAIESPSYKKESIYLHAVCRVVSMAPNGIIRCTTPCVIDFDQLDYIDVNSPHKISVNANRKSLSIRPVSKVHRDAVAHEDMILLTKRRSNTLYTPTYPIRIENVQILSQPAPSPDKLNKFKPKYGLAWYIDRRKL